MAFTLPSFQESLNAVIADFRANLVISYQGQQVPLDFSPDSALLAFCRGVCLVGDGIAQLVETSDASLRLRTATGSDLDDLGALVGVDRLPGNAASLPVKFGRTSPADKDYPLPAGATILARDNTGTASLAYVTAQDPLLADGVADIIATSTSATWLLLKAAEVGTAYNVAAGTVALLQGQPITGVDTVSNPPVSDPGTAPTLTNVGSAGSTTYQYRVVHHGTTGTTLPSPVATTATGNATLNGTNKNTITWAPPTDTTTTDVFKLVGGLWALLGTAAVGTTALDDTGQATSTATLPSVNTTNQATGGVDVEGDEAYRARIPTALSVAAKSTMDALLAAVQDVAGVQAVWGADLTPGLGQVTLHVLPISTPMGSDVSADVGAAIATTKAAGVQVLWSEQLKTLVSISVTVKADSTVVSPASLITPIQTALAAYFATIALGDTVRASEVLAAITDVPGVAYVTIATLGMTPAGGSTYSGGADVPGAGGILYALGTLTVSIS